jgi:hypothetical protein
MIETTDKKNKGQESISRSMIVVKIAHTCGRQVVMRPQKRQEANQLLLNKVGLSANVSPGSSRARMWVEPLLDSSYWES